jgi:hypothetical protein
VEKAKKFYSKINMYGGVAEVIRDGVEVTILICGILHSSFEPGSYVGLLLKSSCGMAIRSRLVAIIGDGHDWRWP